MLIQINALSDNGMSAALVNDSSRITMSVVVYRWHHGWGFTLL